MARLAQSAERKALNLVVVGSSPTVGVLFLVSFGDKPAGANCQTANPHEEIKGNAAVRAKNRYGIKSAIVTKR